MKIKSKYNKIVIFKQEFLYLSGSRIHFWKILKQRKLCKSTEKHQKFRLRRAISTEITTKCRVLSHLNPPEGRNILWRCFSKKFQNHKKTLGVSPGCSVGSTFRDFLASERPAGGGVFFWGFVSVGRRLALENRDLSCCATARYIPSTQLQAVLTRLEIQNTIKY